MATLQACAWRSSFVSMNKNTAELNSQTCFSRACLLRKDKRKVVQWNGKTVRFSTIGIIKFIIHDFIHLLTCVHPDEVIILIGNCMCNKMLSLCPDLTVTIIQKLTLQSNLTN